jgi:hypothetical protein
MALFNLINLDLRAKLLQYVNSMQVATTSLLSLLLLAGPATLQAQYTCITNAGDTNTLTITGYTGSGGIVDIPQVIGSQTVTGIGDYAFYGSGLTSVTVPDSVTSLGEGAFGDCSSLTNASVGIGVTNIAEYAFYYCANLTNVAISNSVTSIDDFAFYWCYSLTSLTIPDGVTYIGNDAFEDAGLTSVAIPGTVNTIGDGAFDFCYSLTNVALADGLASIGQSAFGSCAGLTNVTIPGSVNSIGDSAFQACASLSTVTIGDGVASIGENAFAGTSLTSITIPRSVADIGVGVFEGDAALTAITVDAQNSFYSSVNGVLFDNSQTTLVEYPGGLGGSYMIPAGITNIGAAAFYECASLTSVTIPGSVTGIGDHAFYDCAGLVSVTLPGSVAGIGEFAFGSCRSLMGVYCNGNAPAADSTVFNLDSFATLYYLPCTTGWSSHFAGLPAVQSSQDEFTYTTNLWAITITGYFGSCGTLAIPTNINGCPVTSIGANAFHDCTSLTSLTIPGSITSIGNSAFNGCTSLTDVYFTGNAPAVGSGVFLSDSNATVWCLPCTAGWSNSFAGLPVMQSWEGDFSCTTNAGAITITGYTGTCGAVTIPTNINGLPVTSIGPSAFYFCTNLTSVTIPGSIATIGDGAFQFCVNLTCVTIASGVTSIGEAVFYGCVNLTNVTIPVSVTSIGVAAFQTCFSLTSVTVPASVTSIGYAAFNDCPRLGSIYFMGNAPAVESSSFLSDTRAAFYYLPGATGWSNFSAITGLPSVLWNPFGPSGNASFGVRNNQFGFSFTGPANLVIVVEAATSLASPVWTPLLTNTLINGSFSFGDAQWMNYPGRYYRITSP